jgi:hypothetical protein
MEFTTRQSAHGKSALAIFGIWQRFKSNFFCVKCIIKSLSCEERYNAVIRLLSDKWTARLCICFVGMDMFLFVSSWPD